MIFLNDFYYQRSHSYYQASCVFRFTEEDVYSEGCLPETSITSVYDIEFKNSSLDQLIKMIQEHFGVTDNECLFNSCEEKGRLDIQLLEDENGYKAYPSDIKLWKKNQKRLWLATYILQIDYIKASMVDLSRFENN